MAATPDVPRIAPLPPKEWPPAMREAFGALRIPNPRHPFPSQDPGRPKGLNVLGILAYHPDLTRAYHAFTGHILFGTTLTPRQRELAVLRVAAVRRADYEWAQHVVLAGDAGVTPEEIARVAAGPGADGWAPLERGIVAAVDELLAEARIGDATWQVLAADFDEQQLLDLVFTVGCYDALAMAMRSFGVQPDDDLAEWLPTGREGGTHQ